MSETDDDAAADFGESVARLRESWMAMFGMGPGSASGPRQDIANDLLHMPQNMLGFATAFAEPLRLFVESQQELSEQVTRWADSQRDLAEIAAAWAQSQRKLSELLSTWIIPGSHAQNDG
jgi:hypothetical protein